ncbi:hypothetical protein PAXRUDRAFT_17270 [Paxillus rubicundulus Ve08.2h10]|uniref:Fungal-type protein kinase domain-containing protein n=1 Tax=Paxillus rubicundulus Ve08.2h10 TaxID=930991 RepID=A0A0D0D2M2_9AGAM|nr:hypothetical protein PAXRUDRAFT_17270 [Paxillus rubicundulus Ve08.2h10]
MNLMGDEMQPHVIGPMPVLDFLDMFLPKSEINNYTEVVFADSSFKNTIAASGKLAAYNPFIRGMAVFSPSLHFMDSHAKPDAMNCSEFTFHVAPDVCVYSSPDVSGSDVSQLNVHVEFKWDADHNPFSPLVANSTDKSKVTFLCNSAKAKDTLGQITAYAAAQLGPQYNAHAFSILVVGMSACLLRWDREGVVMTDEISYNEQSELTEFFSHYSQATAGIHGVNTTVTLADKAEATSVREVLKLPPTTCMFKTAVQTIDDDSNLTKL